MKAQLTIAAVDVAEVPMSVMPIAGRPFRCTVAAILLGVGCAVAPRPSPAATLNPPSPRVAPSYSNQGEPPAQYPYYALAGQYEPYYCYYYPANCAPSSSYPFYDYPPSYYRSPSYGYAWPHRGGVGFGIIVGPVFGFAPGIVVNRRFVVHRGIRIHRQTHVH